MTRFLLRRRAGHLTLGRDPDVTVPASEYGEAFSRLTTSVGSQ